MSYEVDCSTALTTPPTFFPFVVSLDGTAVPDPQFYNGAAIHTNLNGAAVTLIGPVLAGFDTSIAAPADRQTFGVSGSFKWGSMDANATGADVTETFSGSANVGATLAGTDIVFTAGSSAIVSTSGAFTAADEGKAIAATDGGVPTANPVIPNAVVLHIIDAHNALLIDAATAAPLAGGALLSGTYANTVYVGNATITLTLSDLASHTFTSAAATPPAVGSFEMTSLPTAGSPPVATWSFLAGFPVPVSNCAITGGGTGILPITQAPPALPSAFASTVLSDPPPVNQTQPALNIGTSSTNNPITVTATDGVAPDNTPANTFMIRTLPSAGTLKVGGVPVVAGASIPASSPGSLNLTYDAPAAVGAQSFQFTAGDANTPATSRLAADDVTVNMQVGTPPVDQKITEVISGAQLVLSCTAPVESAGTGTVTPLLACPIIPLPAITLDGTQQSPSAAINPIYVSDNRGDPGNVWTLSTYMVQNGSSNTNAGCATATDFCNQGPGVGSNSVPNATFKQNHIPAANLAISAVSCTAEPGNYNPDASHTGGGAYGTSSATPPKYAAGFTTTASPGFSLCSASAPNAGGTFKLTGTFTLTIPSSTAAGTYVGVVEYLVV